MTVELREAVKNDIPVLKTIIREVFDEYNMIFNYPDELPDFIRFEEYYGNPDHKLFALLHNGRVTGCGGLKFEQDRAVISRVYVSRKFRGRGFGKRLLGHLMDTAAEAGFTRLCLWTDTRFTSAHRFYKSLGFQSTGEARPLNDVNKSYEYYFETTLK